MVSGSTHGSSADEYAAMFRFLDAFDNQTYPNDVGGLFGQLSTLRQVMPVDRGHEQEWQRAVSLAVAAH